MSATLTQRSDGSELGSRPGSGVMNHLYHINVDQYERLGAAGVLDGQPVEWINGLLVRKKVKNPPRVLACEATRDQLLPLILGVGGSRSKRLSGFPTSTSPSPTSPSCAGRG